MGQQQLLILVLTIVIVGLAAMLGGELFDTNTTTRYADLLVNYCVQVSTDVTAWHAKKSPMLGGGKSYEDIDNLSTFIEDLGINPHRIPGALEVEQATKNSMIIRAQSCDREEVGVRVTIVQDDIEITEISYVGDIQVSEENFSRICGLSAL